MEAILRADQIKPDFEGLKKRWDELLSKYFDKNGSLISKFTISVPCPFCKKVEKEFNFELNGFNHISCKECGTLYVSPRLNDICIEELYSDEYYNEVYTRSMLPVFEKRKELIGKRKFNQVISFTDKKVGKVLDIGAGIGEVTDVFKDAGWTTHAIEMNPVAYEWLKGRSHDVVFHGPLDQFNSSEKYDIIMAWGVVEHVTNPDEFLKTVFNYLTDGGIFVSEVPHGQCLLVDAVRKISFDPKRILMGEQHIVLFSASAYRQLHERNGFKELHLQTNGLDIDTIFKETNQSIPDNILSALQESIDSKMYGDLLRGFWRK